MQINKYHLSLAGTVRSEVSCLGGVSGSLIVKVFDVGKFLWRKRLIWGRVLRKNSYRGLELTLLNEQAFD